MRLDHLLSKENRCPLTRRGAEETYGTSCVVVQFLGNGEAAGGFGRITEVIRGEVVRGFEVPKRWAELVGV